MHDEYEAKRMRSFFAPVLQNEKRKRKEKEKNGSKETV